MKIQKPAELTDKIIAQLRSDNATLYFEPTDFFILRRIVFLALLHGHNSPRRTLYATPGQRYLSQSINYHRVTISRRISFLREKGMLAITYRRKVAGEFQTNLYRFGTVLWASIRGVTNQYYSFFHRVTPGLHIVTPDRVNNTNKVNGIDNDTELQALYDRIERKLFVKEGSPPAE